MRLLIRCDEPSKCMGAFFLLCFLSVANAAELASDDCQPLNGITPICGFLAPEDLELIEGENALVVGGFNLDNEIGDIRILRLADHSVETVYRVTERNTSADPTNWGDPNCPGPPSGFAAHGIHLSNNPGGSKTLLVVNHTSREAIEWFEITSSDGDFSARWRGCVVVDEQLWLNDVAMLPKGGFVASHMMPREIAGTIFDRPPDDRVETGFIVEWQRDTGWRKITGTDGALPNGIQVSADGAVIYNSHYLANQVVALERASGRRLWTAAITGAPDNLSMTPSGKLLVASHLVSLRTLRDECMLQSAPYCGLRFAVSSVDPANGAVTQLIESSGAPFGGATVAVEAHDYIYLGAFAGNRIGRIAAPRTNDSN